MPEPVDIAAKLAEPKTYERTLLRIFGKKRERGQAFRETYCGVTYFGTASNRKKLAKIIAKSVVAGQYHPRPVDLWYLETEGKRRAAHEAGFVDHVVASSLCQLLTHNAICYGMPGVYSYLPGRTNTQAARDLGTFVRKHRRRVGPRGGPVYIIQSDFEAYGDNLPMDHNAALWPILREVASLGASNGELDSKTWDLIISLARPTVRDEGGTEFQRLRGVAMGTPLVPILSDLAVLPMDRAIQSIDGVFYARYNDDFVIAHPDLDALHEADARIDALLDELGVKRKLAKELRTALCANGIGSEQDPAYRGRQRIDYLGLSITHAGTITVNPRRLRRFIGRIATRIDGVRPALSSLPLPERARQLVVTTNVMLDARSPFAVPGLAAVLDNVTDRGSLKDLDFRIARKIVQAATGLPGVKGFRQLPPSVLRGEMGLVSLVRLRNSR
ncbi:MAG: hypothetical protein AB7G47_03180 [Mycolicibacterium sp.]|uniref:hypothetical protein n=1 Tax=Mycolicibacterium sp. TaxID=2320850 RepID=UPI003D144C19